MTQNSLIERLRASRHSRSVLKTKLVTLKGRIPNCPILVFEGDDDKVVYGRWMARLRHDVCYGAFVCKGKQGVATVQAILRDDLGSLKEGVYLFIDRDFDDRAGFDASDDIFMTDTYSVENYLVSETVLRSLLRDEFPCHDHPDIIDNVLAQFRTDYSDFLAHTEELNRRLFIYRRTQTPMSKSFPNKLSDLATVSAEGVAAAVVSVDDTMPAIFAIPRQRHTELSAEFAKLDPAARYRGKNALMFFKRWLDVMATDCDERQRLFDHRDLRGKVRRQEMTLGALASKSTLPAGLPAFVARIAA